MNSRYWGGASKDVPNPRDDVPWDISPRDISWDKASQPVSIAGRSPRSQEKGLSWDRLFLGAAWMCPSWRGEFSCMEVASPARIQGKDGLWFSDPKDFLGFMSPVILGFGRSLDLDLAQRGNNGPTRCSEIPFFQPSNAGDPSHS